MKRILLIPGDGIGPEVMKEGKKLLRKLEFITTEVDWGAERWLKEKVGIPSGELELITHNYDAILFGALGDPRIPDMAHGREILLGLRTGLDLYVNLRPVKLLDERLSIFKDKKNINIIIFRENTQDTYAGAGGALNLNTHQEIAIDNSMHTYAGVERIIREAFSYADRHQRPTVTLVDKSNAIKFGGSLWQRVFKKIAAEFFHIKANHRFVDLAAMNFVQKPEDFDVIVTSNLFGDILSDLGAGLVGGLGLAPSANINPGVIALFEPVHGSAPDIVGQQKANPFAMFLSIGMMLEYFGHTALAQKIEEAIKKAISTDRTTPDLRGNLTTEQAAEAVLTQL
jgi:3-isopropylmalate dehydrogenase